MTSLTDLSKLSGYSKATVSRALSGNGYVSPEARTIIQDLANELDYTPNAIAQELAAGTTKNIGVVLPYVKHPFFSQILEGILDKSFETGYKIVILPSNYDQNLELQYLEQLRKKAFEALIFTSRKYLRKPFLNTKNMVQLSYAINLRPRQYQPAMPKEKSDIVMPLNGLKNKTVQI
ncbi:LacI family DNA-binding transcriptional regulator [Lactococcus cremoris]|uniref:LacI family DNA-binding transcriptional regulator n=1 Tax=Lactococcus lactis subsp. cremoris TaxID=1359 RepID=UPI0021A99068|nr:LacI family DNA-binding transcriptional regulator [Lactococcus cremoris]